MNNSPKILVVREQGTGNREQKNLLIYLCSAIVTKEKVRVFRSHKSQVISHKSEVRSCFCRRNFEQLSKNFSCQGIGNREQGTEESPHLFV
ncbi:MAG: hypothetical protein F6K39_29675 [Okeania sp. SIO3B3]|nr:hypothetical protein [Okeania sp. SIO3B3]